MQNFFAQNAPYVVLVVVLVVWLGIFGYLYGIDRKLKRLEEFLKG